MTYTVEYSACSKMWVVKDVLGRIVSHYDSERNARNAAAREGKKTGRRTQRSVVRSVDARKVP